MNPASRCVALRQVPSNCVTSNCVASNCVAFCHIALRARILFPVQFEHRHIFGRFDEDPEIGIVPLRQVPDRVVAELLHRLVAKVLDVLEIRKIDFRLPGKGSLSRVATRAVRVFGARGRRSCRSVGWTRFGIGFGPCFG